MPKRDLPAVPSAPPRLMAGQWQGLPRNHLGTSGRLWSHLLLRTGSAEMQNRLLGLLRLQKGLSPSRGRTCKLLSPGKVVDGLDKKRKAQAPAGKGVPMAGLVNSGGKGIASWLSRLTHSPAHLLCIYRSIAISFPRLGGRQKVYIFTWVFFEED